MSFLLLPLSALQRLHSPSFIMQEASKCCPWCFQPLTPPVLKECQDEGVPCTSPPRAACSRSASHFFRSKLAVLASHVLKRIRQEAAKSRGPQLHHFLSQMKSPPRACFNGTGDDYVLFFLQSRTDVELFFFWI